MVKLPAMPWLDNWPADGLTLEHAGPEPINFPTRKSLQQFCKEKNLSSGALL